MEGLTFLQLLLSLCGILNNVPYYFLKNLQGDVIAIVDKDAQTVARYSYDAWGVPMVTEDISGCSIATINPFRYRSYFYDEETEMYYLQSRYYDVRVGRFVNADDVVVLIMTSRCFHINLSSYCENSPVTIIDTNGYSPKYINSQYGNYPVDVNGIVKKMKDIKWGWLGNIADHGCGVIAAYNVLQYYNSNINFGDVLNELLWMGGPLGMGKLGTQWSVMTKFLCKKFWVVYTASSWTYWWGIKAELSQCVIVLFKWPGLNGMHFIAGIGTGNGGVGGSFKFYNTGLGIEKQKVSIWKLIDVIKQNGGTPFAFWGVSGKKGWW